MKKNINYIDSIEPSIKEARKRRGAEVLINNFILEPKYINLGAGKKYMLKTYGCQGNLADSEKIAGILEMMGYVETNVEIDADFVLFNTCAIRENAEERVFGEIGRFEKFRKQKPDMIIGICGCMPQEERTINKIKKTYPHINIVFGTHNIADLPKFLFNAINEQRKTLEVLSSVGILGIVMSTIVIQAKKAIAGISTLSNVSTSDEEITWKVEEE